MRPQTSNNIEDWLAALSAPEPVVDTPPEEWLTREQIQSLLGFSRFKAQTYLADAARNGRVEVKRFRIRHATGFTSQTPHYRLLK